MRLTKQGKDELRQWLAAYPHRLEVEMAPCGMRPGEATDARQERIFKGLLYDLSLAIDEFGYEAVYFGVGVHAFPEAVDPWRDGQY